MFAAPNGTPSSIVKKLDEAFHKEMGDSEFIQTMEKMELGIYYRNSEETKEFLREAYFHAGKLIDDLKIPKETEKKQ